MRRRERRFEDLVREHHRAVATYARSLASTSTIAEDATQETFVRAWKHLDSFRGEGSFEGWLIRICRNAVFDLERRERRRRTDLDAEVVTLAEPADDRPEVLELLDDLRPDHREILVLCGVLGYDYESAAAVLDVPVGTVRSRLHRARAELSLALSEAESA